MALKKTITVFGMGYIHSDGLIVKTGEATVTTPPMYIKVESVSGDKTSVKVVVTFKNEATDEHFTRKEYSFAPNIDGSNFIKQAYVYLKTLPEFEDATDC